jgi:hypothetical protein
MLPRELYLRWKYRNYGAEEPLSMERLNEMRAQAGNLKKAEDGERHGKHSH